jgi:hypothetical protein
MLSRSKNADLVRRYFIELEDIIRKYYVDIHTSTLKQMNMLEHNQQPKLKVDGGVIYIIKAGNNNEDNLFKIGKTNNINKRMKTYNTGNANDIEVIKYYRVNDIDNIESCIKLMAKKLQYRKNKEIYKVKIEDINYIIKSCAKLNDAAASFSKDLNNNDDYYILPERNS